MSSFGAILFVDDELENVELAAEIIEEATGRDVITVATVQEAVAALQTRDIAMVIMDVFIPLGAKSRKVLGPRARRYQEHVQHLGGLVLLEEIHRLSDPPMIFSHTACTDHVLLEVFGEQVEHKIPKPAPLDTLLHHVMQGLEQLKAAEG